GGKKAGGVAEADATPPEDEPEHLALPVLDAIDRSLARDYGRAPGELDHLALGAVGMMQAEALVKSRRRERERLALAGLVVDGLLNYGGMRGADFKPHPFGWHLAKWTGDEVP